VRIDRNIFAGLATLRVAAPNHAAGGRPGDRRSRARGGGVELADFRPYAPGDDLRLVDWNIFARLETVLVRLFHEDRDLSVVIIVDGSASMGFGSPRKLDHAGELAEARSEHEPELGPDTGGGFGDDGRGVVGVLRHADTPPARASASA